MARDRNKQLTLEWQQLTLEWEQLTLEQREKGRRFLDHVNQRAELLAARKQQSMSEASAKPTGGATPSGKPPT